jgi:hypothetical protein
MLRPTMNCNRGLAQGSAILRHLALQRQLRYLTNLGPAEAASSIQTPVCGLSGRSLKPRVSSSRVKRVGAFFWYISEE